MKLFKTVILLTIFAALVLIFLFSCKKDNAQTIIFGRWTYSNKYEKAELFNKTYFFNADSTVKITSTIIDSASRKVLGYQYLATGKFSLNSANRLTIYALVGASYNGGTPYYTSIDNLVPNTATTIAAQTIVMKSNNIFYFYYPPCPANANCTGELDFVRQ